MTPVDALKELGGTATTQAVCDRMLVDHYNKNGLLPARESYERQISEAIAKNLVVLNKDWKISLKSGEST